MAELVNRKELSLMLGKSGKTISLWNKEGMPSENDEGRLFDSAKVFDWIMHRSRKAGDVSEERARLLKAQADLKEIELRIISGESLNVNEVEKAWADVAIHVRTRFSNLPSKVALILSQESDPAKIQTILLDEITECLSEIGETPPKIKKAKYKDAKNNK